MPDIVQKSFSPVVVLKILSKMSTMLARRSLVRAAVNTPAALGAAPSNARNMATLREIELRLKSVRNIEKITKVRRDSI